MAPSRRLLAIAATSGLLVSAGTTAIAAAAGSSGPTVVIEAPDDSAVRAAISFPTGWRLEAGDEPWRREIHALAVDERCEFTTRASAFADLTTDVDDFEAGLAPGSGYIRIERASVELPAGPAERVDFAANDEGGRWSVYVVAGEGYMHELWCRGDELPEDRWLPIAETLDLHPDPATTSSAFEATVTRPDAGVAMAFGEAWQVRGSSTNQGLLYATSDAAVCALNDYSAVPAATAWEDVDDMHDEYVEIARGRSDLTVEEISYLDLPAGRTGFALIGFEDGAQAIRYSFADPRGETMLALFCVGEPRPADRYASLAGSVVWLAAD